MNNPAARKQVQPWKPADATDAIRAISLDENLTLDLTLHAKEQMGTRDLYVSDILHVLKHGFVFEPATPATHPKCFKYKIESTTPASTRAVRIVAIPWSNPPEIKVVTVMWRDEHGS